MLLALLSFAIVLEISLVFFLVILNRYTPTTMSLQHSPQCHKNPCSGHTGPKVQATIESSHTDSCGKRTKWGQSGHFRDFLFTYKPHTGLWVPGRDGRLILALGSPGNVFVILYLKSSDLHIMSQFWLYGSTRSNWQMIALNWLKGFEIDSWTRGVHCLFMLTLVMALMLVDPGGTKLAQTLQPSMGISICVTSEK